LENLKLPNQNGKKIRLFPIFRDTDELPTSANLGDNLYKALSKSRYLVVGISKQSMASKWVSEEIAFYSQHHANYNIILLFLEDIDISAYDSHVVSTLSERVHKVYHYQQDIKSVVSHLAALLSGTSVQKIRKYQRWQKYKIAIVSVAASPILLFFAIIVKSLFVSFGLLSGQSDFTANLFAQTPENQARIAKAMMDKAKEKSAGNKQPMSIVYFNDRLAAIENRIESCERALKMSDMDVRFLESDFRGVELLLNSLRNVDLSQIEESKLLHLSSLELRFTLASQQMEVMRKEQRRQFQSPFQ
jgi:hypothetical protein